MTSDVTGTSTVYYTPYLGNAVPSPTGSSGFSSYYTFSQLTLTLNSTDNTAGNIYDVFLVENDGANICTGPAWASTTSRGTGAGTTQLTNIDGLWVNANTISACYNNGVNIEEFVATDGLYVGSVYMTANGETSVNFKPSAAAGGSNNVIGIWNAYNRVRISSLVSDSNADWTYATSTWEPLDGASANTNFRATYLDGLEQSFVSGRVTTIGYNATAGNGVKIGVVQDSTSATPGAPASYQSATNGTGVGAANFAAEENFLPALGLHYLQAMQDSNNSTTATFAFNGGQTFLLFEGEF